MKAVKPYVTVPGDNQLNKDFVKPCIMARAGELIGMNRELAVWRFGFSPESEAHKAYKVCIPQVGNWWPGFMWVIATRKTGKVKETFMGAFLELPSLFKDIIDFDVR